MVSYGRFEQAPVANALGHFAFAFTDNNIYHSRRALKKSKATLAKLNESITTAILLVPAVAIISAAITLDGLAGYTGVAADVFGVQDYFDKAVDLLIPVFLSFVGSVFLGVTIAMLSPDESEPTRKQAGHERGYRKRTWKRTLILALLAVFFIAITPHKKNSVMLIAAFVVFFPYALNWVYKVADHNWPERRAETHNMAMIGIMISIATLIAIQYNLEEKLLDAEQRHMTSGDVVILDKFSIGWLILKDGQYHLANGESELNLLVSGTTVASKRSHLCNLIGGAFCFNTVKLEQG